MADNKENLHYPIGTSFTLTHKARALMLLNEDELAAIYNLVESHSPTLRYNALEQFEKSSLSSIDDLPLSKENLKYFCSDTGEDVKIKNMLTQLQKLPKEWTIVQLTSQFNLIECQESDPQKFYTNPLHLTVFKCGVNCISPVLLTLEPPVDEISGKVIDIRHEMNSILKDNNNGLSEIKKRIGKTFKCHMDQMIYRESRYLLNSRLENLVKLLQDKWLNIWRCLFIGNYEDDVEEIIKHEIENVLKIHDCENLPNRSRYLLECFIKGSNVLTSNNRIKALKCVFPQESQLRSAFLKLMINLHKKINLSEKKRLPVILIPDEKLDFLPWEMIDVLNNQSISRMPSLHFIYALYQEHRNSIINGYKTISQNGTFVINPSLDLKAMEVRLCNFFNYWLPSWKGIAGVTPSESDFQNMLTKNNIFIYSGHGNGTQFFPSEKIKLLKVDSVVLLFGCGSVRLQNLGVQVEMSGSYQMYMIACSPCVIGMLWEVTDFDTDLLTTEFLSQWLASEAKIHWQYIDKLKWSTDGSVQSNKEKLKIQMKYENEPELLRALWKAKNAAKQYFTKAACVARGLPVKIISSKAN